MSSREPRSHHASPAGAGGVIRRASRLGGSALLAISLPVAAGAHPPFPAQGFPTDGSPQYVEVADVDGDGVLDLVTLNSPFGSPNYPRAEVAVLLGNGDGTFGPPLLFPTGDEPTELVVADCDGDGTADVVVANSRSDDVSVLRGQGDGSLDPVGAFPAGDEPTSLTVRDLDGDGALDVVTTNGMHGNLQVLLGRGDCTFDAPVPVPAGEDPRHVLAADVDGDGTPDLVVADRVTRDLHLLRGHGDSIFAAPVALGLGPFAVGRGPRQAVAADLDRNGTVDLASVNGDDVSILLNRGSGGGFEAPLAFASGGGAMASVDLDGDGILDLVTAHTGFGTANKAGEAAVLLGNGDGSFQPAAFYKLGLGLGNLVAQDLNGDGAPDLARPSRETESVSVLLGRGDGTFPTSGVFPVGHQLRSLVAADFDRDGSPDLASAGWVDDNVSVLLGDGRGHLTLSGTFPTGEEPSAVSAADVDADGILDLLTANRASHDVSVLRGRGDGTFEPASTFSAGSGARGLATADFDGDGILDLVTANQYGEDLSLFVGKAGGDFRTPASLPLGFSPRVVVASDLDGDGHQDLAAAGDGLRVLVGRGDGTFLATGTLALEPIAIDLQVADLDRDGEQDLVAANGDVVVFLGNGDGTFEGRDPIETLRGSNQLAVADVDGDTMPDLVASNATHDVSLLLGLGDGSFLPARTFLAGGVGPVAVAVLDLDRDLLPDLAVANNLSDEVSVLTNLRENVCSAVPARRCLLARGGRLTIDEGRTGREKIKILLSQLDAETTRADFGDPVSGNTRYDVCLYDGSRELTRELVVARAGQACEPGGHDCWSAEGRVTWSYKDGAGAADGVERISVSSGPTGGGKIRVRAANRWRRGQLALPVGTSTALRDHEAVTVQVRTEDGVCVEATLGDVRRAGPARWKARTERNWTRETSRTDPGERGSPRRP